MIKRLASDKATGPDDITNRILQTSEEQVIDMIYIYMVIIWEVETYPGAWGPYVTRWPLCNPCTKEAEKTDAHQCPTEVSTYSTHLQNSLKTLLNHVSLNSQNSITPLPPLRRGHESPDKFMTPSTSLLLPYKNDPNTGSPVTVA